MVKRLIWFLIGMVTAVVLVVGGIVGGAYYIASTQSIDSIEDMIGQELPILKDDPESLRDKNLIELYEFIMQTVSNEDVTIGQLRETFGLQELITDDFFGVDLRGVYDIKLSEVAEENGPALPALMDGITLRVLTEGVGMDLSHVSFLSKYVDYPILDFIKIFNTMSLGTLLESTEGMESNAILDAIMYVEDTEGEFVRWTNPDGIESYARYEDFNTSRDDIVKFTEVEEGKFRVKRQPATGEVYYINVNGYYLTGDEADAYYTALATAKRYYGLTFLNGDFAKVINGITLGDVITNINPGDLLYDLKNVKLGNISSEINGLIDDFAIASFMSISTSDGILSGIAVTEVEPTDAYVITAEGEYVPWTGTYDANYRDGLFFKKTGESGDKYIPYYILNESDVYESSAVADIEFASYTGSYYVATTVAELSTKVEAITVIDAIGGLNKINTQSILQAIAFAKYEVGSGYTGDVLYKKVENTDSSGPAYVFEVADAGYTGEKYYPIKATQISTRINDLTIQDVLAKPEDSAHQVIKDLWNSNCRVDEIGSQINTIIDDLTIQDVLDEPAADAHKVIKDLWNSNCKINEISNEINDVINGLTIQDVLDEPAADAHKVIKDLWNSNCKINEISNEINDVINGLTIQDVLDEPAADAHEVIKDLWNSNCKINEISGEIDGIINDLTVQDVLDEPAADAHKLMKDLWNSNCKVTEISTKVNELVNGLTVQDVLDEPAADAHKLIKDLWNSNCKVTEISTKANELVNGLTIQDVLDAPAADAHKVIKDLYNSNCKINEISSEIDEIVTGLTIQDVLDEPAADAHKIMKELYESNCLVTNISTEVSKLIDGLTVSDAMGGLDKINGNKIIQALAFAEYTAGCGYEGTEFYKQVLNTSSEPNAPKYVYELAEDGYTGTKYYPVKATDISTAVDTLTIQDVMNEPASDAHSLIIELYNSNCLVTNISTEIDSLIGSLTIQDVMDEPGADAHSLIKKLYDSDCLVSNIDDKVSDLIEELRIRDVLDEPDPATANKIILKLWENNGTVDEIGSFLNTLTIQDVMDDPGEDGNKILKKIYDMNPSLNDHASNNLTSCFNSLLNSLEVADVITLTADSSTLMKALLYTHEYVQVFGKSEPEILADASNYYVLMNDDEDAKHVCVECLTEMPTAGTYTVYRYLTVADVTTDEHEQYYWYDEVAKVYKKVDSTTAADAQIYTATKVADLEHRMNEIRAGDVFADMENGKGLGAIISRSTLIVDISHDIEAHLSFDSLTVEKLFNIAGEDIEQFMTNKGMTGTKRDAFKNMNIKTLIDEFADMFVVLG